MHLTLSSIPYMSLLASERSERDTLRSAQSRIEIIGRGKRAPHRGVQSRFRVIYIIGERSEPLSRVFNDPNSRYIYIYWRASEASETLSGLFNRESYIYILLGMCSFQHKWASERQWYFFVLLHNVIMK